MSLERAIKDNQRQDGTVSFYISPVESIDSGIANDENSNNKLIDSSDEEALLQSLDCLFEEESQQQKCCDVDDWSPFADSGPWIRVIDRRGNYRLAWLRVDSGLNGFKPEDLQVELDLSARLVRVSAKRFRLAKHAWTSRAYQKDFKLPQNLALGSLELRASFLNRDSSLIVVVSVVNHSSSSKSSSQSSSPTCRRNSTPASTTDYYNQYERSLRCDFQDGYGLTVSLDDAAPVSCQIIANISCSSSS